MYTKIYFGIFLSFIAIFNAIISSGQCNPTTSVSATYNYSGTAAQITWPAVPGATGYEVYFGPYPSTPTTGTTISTNNFNVNSLTLNNTYSVCIRTLCSSGSSTWFCDTLHASYAPCPPPTQVVASATSPHSASLSWVAASGVPGYEYGYSSTPGGPGVNKFPTTSTSATISNLTSYHTHYFMVRSVCYAPYNNMSNWVTDTAATPKAVGISEVSNEVLNIYPNPTTDKFFIEAGQEAIANLALTDIYGKALFRSSLQAKERKEIDMTPYAPGLYVLTYETSSGTISRKIRKL